MRKRFLLLSALLAAFASAEVRLCGIQGDDLIFKPENNPYIITGDVVIKARTLWNIGPGIIIKVANTPTCTLSQHTDEITDPNKGHLIAIYIKGAFTCVGRPENRVRIEPLNPAPGKVSWYGIVFDGANNEYAKLFYTDISGALYGVKAINCSPTIRNCLFQGNQTALYCKDLCQSKIHNNIIADNMSTGLLNENAAPEILNNIFTQNLVGVWSDLKSKFKLEYNDFWKNADGDFNNCPPRFGVICAVNKRKDSCDFMNNLFRDPVFCGSASHKDSIVKDIHVGTDTTKADVVNRKLSRVVVQTVPDSVRQKDEFSKPHKPWQLSKYSRLIDAGSPKSAYRDPDGTPNDIGLYGCAEFKFE